MRVALRTIAILTGLLAGADVPPARAADSCGVVVTLAAHGGTTLRYSLAGPAGGGARTGLVLLVGGGGHLDLDGEGCPRALKGNSLVRSRPQFHREGFVTALVDAPSDHPGEDGLGGFRLAPEHAEDLGKVVADLRVRVQGPVWLVGTSRGTISAVNAAARLRGAAAPDGIVLTSALMVGARARKAWVADSVFDVRLEDIRVPVLVIGHAADQCIRSPASRSAEIADRTNGAREQVVAVTGGPGEAMNFAPGIEACAGRSPHGFICQEAEVAAGIARFIRGGRY
jgi:pimeloyl-ACP methyl ester carboxylesterase